MLAFSRCLRYNIGMEFENYEIGYPEALKALAARLRERPKGKDFSFDEYYIVLTPDRYTLQAEKALFGGDGAIDCEVLTLSRLCRRVCGDTVTLSIEGAVMLTASAALEAENLEYYKKAAEYPEFARNVQAALSQISSSAVKIGDVAARVSALPDRGGNTGKKLRDLVKIKEKYDALKESKKSLDAPDRLLELIKAAGTSELITKSHFFVIGYSDATQLIGEVFCAIKKHAKSFEVYGAIPLELKKMLSLKERNIPKIETHEMPYLEVCKTTDAVAEYKEVASLIRDYVYKGGRYGDISIIAPDPRALTRILNEYGIKYNADTSVALYDTAQFTALTNIIRAATDADADTVVALCKSPYSSVKPEWADALDYELTSRGIKHNVLNAKIESDGGKAAVNRIKEILKVFYAAARPEEDDGSSKQSEEEPRVFALGKFSEACTAVIDFCRFEEIEGEIAKEAEKLTGDSGIVMTDAVKPIRSLIELMELYGTDDGDFKADARMFGSAAKAVSVKSLPRYIDRVAVGNVEALRLTACKLLIVVDFNEGVLPVPTADSGLITDADILVTKGEIKPSAKEKNRRSRDELLSVLYNAERAVCFYCDSGESKKASLLSSLSDYEISDGKKIFVGNNKNKSSACNNAEDKSGGKNLSLQTTHDPQRIAYYACVPSAARELSARKMTSYGKALDEAVKRGEDAKEDKFVRRRAKPFIGEVSESAVKHESLSVSELSDWFSCPYKRFLRYTVGLKERKTGEFSAPDFGTLMHEVMKEFVTKELYKYYDESAGDFDNDTIEKIEECARTAAENAEFVLSDKDIERFVENACDYARVNARIITAGKYVPDLLWLERPFNGDILFGEKARIPFKGKIDRADVKRIGDGDALPRQVRVIDYKTGDKKLNFKKIEDGREMQLTLYAAELIENYRKSVASKDGEGAEEDVKVTGMFYIPLPKKYDKEKSALLSGTMIQDFDIAVDYDKDIPYGTSEILKLSGDDERYDFSSGSKRSNTIVKEDRFNELIDISVKNAHIAADEMESGYIERSPAENKECKYCLFGGLCEKRKVRKFADEEGDDNE